MDFKKRIIDELKLTPIQADTMLKDYIDVCEKLSKEYHSEQSNIHDVMPRSLTAENGAKVLLIGEFFAPIASPPKQLASTGSNK